MLEKHQILELILIIPVCKHNYVFPQKNFLVFVCTYPSTNDFRILLVLVKGQLVVLFINKIFTCHTTFAQIAFCN